MAVGAAQAQTDRFWSGTGIWNASSSNWAAATGGPYSTTWTSGSNAIFEGSAGTVTLGEAVSLANLTFNLAGSYAINGNSLNFAPGSIIRTSDNRYNQTITSVITGSPAIQPKDFGAGNQYLGLVFAPASGTQTLGAVLNPDNTGNTDKAGVTFAGATSGNTVAAISYAGNSAKIADTNFQSGGWTVLGNITTGTVRLAAEPTSSTERSTANIPDSSSPVERSVARERSMRTSPFQPQAASRPALRPARFLLSELLTSRPWPADRVNSTTISALP